MKDKTTKGAGRRRFLQMAGLGAAVAGTGLALSGRAQAAAPVPAKATAAGYQETEHVKRYYALARL